MVAGAGEHLVLGNPDMLSRHDFCSRIAAASAKDKEIEMMDALFARPKGVRRNRAIFIAT